MNKLSDGEHNTLTALVAFVATHGIPPTQRELAERSGYHFNTIRYHLSRLQAKGMIQEIGAGPNRTRFRPTPSGFPEMESQLAQAALEQAVRLLAYSPALQAKAQALRAEVGRTA